MGVLADSDFYESVGLYLDDVEVGGCCSFGVGVLGLAGVGAVFSVGVAGFVGEVAVVAAVVFEGFDHGRILVGWSDGFWVGVGFLVGGVVDEAVVCSEVRG